ncbi:MAG TPA: Asp-tRNA(Asn)/Glu-tRNA(Gln) amidotransferase subunit GatA [Candidatus Paceibacterota bacterium]|nr:Asp-tRNA(Asn)/Glu-tRNA(Gln) amidotransferase subunit GatA [Candidatus Paceibacterota bacterium]HQI26190.1 Asp-tRNA(Asn)/Glu-tRNA(Gln) amidotransferase subunit GatA [Candidatus Paceibacterota bacterium]HQJ83917.1 Asp-tRNA(Asn)/Glu-tRNA(Gln) amidotransferase subunit GatA [Candidatus Paceibacterota bacterium]
MRLNKEELDKLTIKTAHEALVRGDFSAVDLTESYLAQIKEKNEELNVYLEVFADAREQATEADRRLRKNDGVTLLTGIPLAIKDNILIEGRKCSSASKMLENYTAVYDATVIKRLKECGAVFLGRTNMDEFAMGGSTESSAFGPTKNPHDKTRVAGGSSGGSASAVGGGLALAALGSDTGGSIRQPSSFCGAVGLKPTYGAVSRYGVMALASSLDQVGPIAKTTEDAEILFDAIRGADNLDSNAYNLPVYPVTPAKLNIGVPYSFLNGGGVAKEVLDNFNQLVEKLKQDGHVVEEVEMPNLHYSLACYYVLMPAEASTNLARFDGVRYGLHLDGQDVTDDYKKTRAAGFGREVRRRIMLGTFVLSAGYYDSYYNKANQARELIKQDYLNVFNQYDAIITPTAPSLAFPIGKNSNDPLQMYLEDIFTVPVNLAGVPAMSIPTGFTAPLETAPKGLPLGVQVAAPERREDILFAFGRLVERLG